MKTIDEILDEWYPTIPDEEYNGLYARDKVKLISQEFADQFRQTNVSKFVEQREILMTIYFKNGMTKKVIKQIGEAINKRIVEGCGKFQTFSDENGNLLLIVNLDEVVYVV